MKPTQKYNIGDLIPSGINKVMIEDSNYIYHLERQYNLNNPCYARVVGVELKQKKQFDSKKVKGNNEDYD